MAKRKRHIPKSVVKREVKKREKTLEKERPGLKGRRKVRKAQEKAEKTAKLGSGKRFGALEKSVAKGLKPSTIRPGQTREEAAEGIAAAIGRKKFGKGRFQKLAAKGRRRK